LWQGRSRLNGMNTTLTSASKQNQNVRIQSPVARAYWASVTRCVARPDGSGEIVHADGRVERLDAEGRPIRRDSAHGFSNANHGNKIGRLALAA